MRLVIFLLLPVCFATKFVDDFSDGGQFDEIDHLIGNNGLSVIIGADKNELKSQLSAFKNTGIGHCLSSKRKSPINIDLGNVTVVSLPSLKFENYDASELLVESIKSNFTASVNGYANWTSRPKISGGPLKGNYYLTEVSWEANSLMMMGHYGHHYNYHYGHTINRAKQDSELQLIHTIDGLPLEEAKKIPNGIVILGVFINRNEHLTQNEMSPFNETDLKIPRTTGVEFKWVPPEVFLPSERESYFVYNGTFSHPPCDCDVTWIILPEPVQLSQSEARTFFLSTGGYIPISSFSPRQKENINVLFNHPVLIKGVHDESNTSTVVLAVLAAIACFVAGGASVFFAKEKLRRKTINGDNSQVKFQIGMDNLNFNS